MMHVPHPPHPPRRPSPLLAALLILIAATIASCARNDVNVSPAMTQTLNHRRRSEKATPEQLAALQPFLDAEERSKSAYFDGIEAGESSAQFVKSKQAIIDAAAATEKKLGELGL